MIRRNTFQKKVIYKAIDELGHTKVEDLIIYIKSLNMDISLSTIYRNLSVLEDDNLIKKVKFEDFDVYEIVKPNHYHFVCIKCEAVIDIDPKEINSDFLNIKTINGNDISKTDLVFYGYCHKCKTLKY